ncbi:DUF2267 domain-containing protein [Pseudonocardia phyllosphaerae]|uniref:DUF2267 domain-containing protein n=1 Tax=Pseudonocardia phyllosphaerae TaxID=3390502 RepID=UPI00397D2B42
MQETEIVNAVVESTGTDTDTARRGVQSTLEVLGQRLAGGESKNLAAQLPAELKNCLPADAPGERFDLAEFYRRVAKREGGVTEAQARQHARATMHAVTVAVTDAEIGHVAGQLPTEYADLLGTEPVQKH